jgi:hypothetical protein
MGAVMGDGTHWIWNNADQHFPGAIQIVDLYHVRDLKIIGPHAVSHDYELLLATSMSRTLS